MRGMSSFGVSEFEQDRPFLTGPAVGEPGGNSQGATIRPAVVAETSQKGLPRSRRFSYVVVRTL